MRARIITWFIPLVCLLCASCVYKYIDCDYDCLLSVPQFDGTTVRNLYVSVHDALGNTVYYRYYSTPAELLNEGGKLRLNLGNGPHTLYAFANVDTLKVSQSSSASASNVQKLSTPNQALVFIAVSDMYTGELPIEANCEVRVAGNMQLQLTPYTGTIKTVLVGFPATSNNLTLDYTGFGTHLSFDGGLFALGSPVIRNTVPGSSFVRDASGNIVVNQHMFPSLGPIGVGVLMARDGDTPISIQQYLEGSITLPPRGTLTVTLTYDPTAGTATIQAEVIPWGGVNGGGDVEI